MIALVLSCSRCGSYLGKLCRDGLAVILRHPAACPHHEDPIPLHAQQSLWRAHEANHTLEVFSIEQDHRVTGHPIQ